jgi:hypothetical protein
MASQRAGDPVTDQGDLRTVGGDQLEARCRSPVRGAAHDKFRSASRLVASTPQVFEVPAAGIVGVRKELTSSLPAHDQLSDLQSPSRAVRVVENSINVVVA